MAIVLSFLVVARASIANQRFMAQRAELEDLYRSSKELVHYMAILSMHDKSEGAQKWRSEVAYRAILLLRITMAALEHQSNHVNSWDLEELETEERRRMRKSLFLESPLKSPPRINGTGSNNKVCATPSPQRRQHRVRPSFGYYVLSSRNVLRASNITRWAHGPRSLRDENLRAPTGEFGN